MFVFFISENFSKNSLGTDEENYIFPSQAKGVYQKFGTLALLFISMEVCLFPAGHPEECDLKHINCEMLLRFKSDLYQGFQKMLTQC